MSKELRTSWLLLVQLVRAFSAQLHPPPSASGLWSRSSRLVPLSLATFGKSSMLQTFISPLGDMRITSGTTLLRKRRQKDWCAVQTIGAFVQAVSDLQMESMGTLQTILLAAYCHEVSIIRKFFYSARQWEFVNVSPAGFRTSSRTLLTAQM